MSRPSAYKNTLMGNARGKHTLDPGWDPTNYWFLCDRCGCDIRAQDGRMTWDGLFVCPDDWEPRHEQDFVRTRADKIIPDGPLRPDEGDGALFIESFCLTNSAICDVGYAGCAIAGNTLRIAYSFQIPEATFGPGTL